jgi:hypothetical protein
LRATRIIRAFLILCFLFAFLFETECCEAGERDVSPQACVTALCDAADVKPVFGFDAVRCNATAAEPDLPYQLYAACTANDCCVDVATVQEGDAVPSASVSTTSASASASPSSGSEVDPNTAGLEAASDGALRFCVLILFSCSSMFFRVL